MNQSEQMNPNWKPQLSNQIAVAEGIQQKNPWEENSAYESRVQQLAHCMQTVKKMPTNQKENPITVIVGEGKSMTVRAEC